MYRLCISGVNGTTFCDAQKDFNKTAPKPSHLKLTKITANLLHQQYAPGAPQSWNASRRAAARLEQGGPPSPQCANPFADFCDPPQCAPRTNWFSQARPCCPIFPRRDRGKIYHDQAHRNGCQWAEHRHDIGDECGESPQAFSAGHGHTGEKGQPQQVMYWTHPRFPARIVVAERSG